MDPPGAAAPDDRAESQLPSKILTMDAFVSILAEQFWLLFLRRAGTGWKVSTKCSKHPDSTHVGKSRFE